MSPTPYWAEKDEELTFTSDVVSKMVTSEFWLIGSVVVAPSCSTLSNGKLPLIEADC